MIAPKSRLGQHVAVIVALTALVGAFMALTVDQWVRARRRVPGPAVYQAGLPEAPSAVEPSQNQPVVHEASQQAAQPAIPSRSQIATPLPTEPPPVESPGGSLDLASLPARAMITGVPAGKQERMLNCEFQSASDIAWYNGVPASWREIFLKVGHDPNGNPYEGFVGKSIDDQPGGLYPNGYGVYADPLAEALQEFGLAARAYHDMSASWLKAQIAAGRPVVVWATHGMRPQQVVEWEVEGLGRVKGVPYEHTFTAVGYDESGVWLNDPYDGAQHHYSWSDFERSWSYLDRMALVIE